jgi:hypothetical protein
VWQYKVLNAYELQGFDKSEIQSIEAGLNKLGAEGWELAAVEPGIPRPSSVVANDRDVANPVYYARPPHYYLKRRANP